MPHALSARFWRPALPIFSQFFGFSGMKFFSPESMFAYCNTFRGLHGEKPSRRFLRFLQYETTNPALVTPIQACRGGVGFSGLQLRPKFPWLF